MARADRRIQTALLSLNPTTQRPAFHGAPSVLGLLRGVTPATAVWRPHPSMNNLREISLHVAFWENSVANRLCGQAVRVAFRSRKTGWPTRDDAVAAAPWQTECELIRLTHQRLVQVVTDFDPDRLDLPADPKTGRIAIELIHGIAEHNLYHAAQMKMLKLLARHAGS
ncbi:MAG: DinB family protein [Phycisphaerae bacterium]